MLQVQSSWRKIKSKLKVWLHSWNGKFGIASCVDVVGSVRSGTRRQSQAQSFYLIPIDNILDDEQLFGTNRLGKIRCKESGFLPPCYFNQYCRSIFHIFYFSSHFQLEAKELICSPTRQSEHVFHLFPSAEYLEPRKGRTKGDRVSINGQS